MLLDRGVALFKTHFASAGVTSFVSRSIHAGEFAGNGIEIVTVGVGGWHGFLLQRYYSVRDRYGDSSVSIGPFGTIVV